MAIVALAAPVSGLRGKIGGIVYSANKSGPYVKAWAKGSNPKTASQSGHRAVIARFAQSWGLLTGVQQQTWIDYAALPAQDKTNSLGEPYSASGFNWYVAINTNLLNAAGTPRDIAPVGVAPVAPQLSFIRIASTVSGLGSFISLVTGSPNLTIPLAIYLELKNSQGRTVQSQIRTHMITEIPNASRIVSFQPQIEAKFGTIFNDQLAFLLVRSQSIEGRQGAADTATDIVD